MKKKQLIIAALLMLATAATGYAKDIKGRVIDGKTKQPLPNVVIEDAAGNPLAVTAADGSFTAVGIDEKKHASVRFRSIGFEPLHVALDRFGTEGTEIVLDESAEGLDELVVTANRKETYIKDMPVITKVITAAQIQKAASSNFRDVLAMAIPGVEMGMHAASQSIRIQGFSGRYLLFLMDGEPLSSQNMENIDFSRVDVNNIERIEYIAGSASALYGSSAIGGVINIITKQAVRPWQLQAGARLTGNYERQYELRGGVSGEKYNASASLRMSRLQPYVVSFEENSTGAVRGSDALAGSARVTYKPLSNLRLKAGMDISRTALHQRKDTLDYDFNTQRFMLGAFWNMAERHSIDFSSSTDFSRRDNVVLKDVKNSKGVVTTPAGRTQDYTDRVVNARIQYNFIVPERHVVNFGFEYFKDWYESNLFHASKTTRSVNNGVLYTQHEYSLTPDLRLTYGLRMDNHSHFGAHVSPKAALLYKLRNVDFRFSYAEGFRSPTMSELYMHFLHPGRAPFYIYGNRDLKPETSRRVTVQAGYNSRRVTLSGSAFYSDIDNKIATMRVAGADNTFHYEYRNIAGRSTLKGVEASLRASVPFGMFMQASYSYTFDDQTFDDGGQRFNLATTRPHTATAMLGYSLTRKRYTADISLTARYLSAVTSAQRKANATIAEEKKNGTFKTNYTNVTDEGYGNVRLVGTLKLLNAYTFQLGIDNLLDYRPTRTTLNSSLSPGRSLIAAIYIDIDRIFKK